MIVVKDVLISTLLELYGALLEFIKMLTRKYTFVIIYEYGLHRKCHQRQIMQNV